MYVDGNIGGSIDGTGGADLGVPRRAGGTAERIGSDGIWSTEVARDPFLPLVLAAEKSPHCNWAPRSRWRSPAAR